MNNGFGERLRHLRKEKDITQGQLAEQLGVVPSAVGKYERVDAAYPSVETLIKIAAYFDVSIDYLLLGKKQPNAAEHSISSLSNIRFAETSNDYPSSSIPTPESLELLHIYEELGGRDRLNLLSYAIKLEQNAEK